jgi:putative two-component system response regulator
MSSIDRRAYSEKLVHEKRIYARSLEHRVQERTGELRTAQEEIIQRLVSASLWRDEETGMHIRRTGLLSEALARAAGWSAAEAELLRQAAPMHDVGKIGIPDAILRKPGQLTGEEYEVIKTHTLIGAEILADSNIPLMQIARQIALNHHEQWDGGGYPSGLVGHNIPEAARIVAIIDVFDALSHDRVYRKALSEDEVAAIMCQGSGSHFDPGLLATFFTILPELYQILSEHPDESLGGVSLIRSFAATLARTNFAEDDEIFQARNGIFTTTLVEEEV